MPYNAWYTLISHSLTLFQLPWDQTQRETPMVDNVNDDIITAAVLKCVVLLALSVSLLM